MKHQKMLNILLNEANDSEFVTRKWNIVNDNSKTNYDAANEIIYRTEVLKSGPCDYNNGYILVIGDNTVTAAPETQVAFKNCAPFSKCITKVDKKTIDDAEDLDLVMPMNNPIEYSSNYSETTGSLWFYSKDEATNFDADIANTDEFKSFKYKASLSGNTAAQPALNASNGILKNAKISAPLKYLSNFWRSREMPLIKSKAELNLNEQGIVFCLQLMQIMLMVTLMIIMIMLSKTQNCILLL